MATAGVMSILKKGTVAGEAHGSQRWELALPACPQYSINHTHPHTHTPQSTRH